MRSLTALLPLLTLSVCAAIALPRSSPLDGEQVYRDNCRRCHIAMHTFSPRIMATVVHHMQVRATLTRDEEAAVLRYLLETAPSKSVVRQQTPAAAQERNTK